MRISELGGEFALIKRLTGKNVTDRNVIKGVGDDCAVLRYTEKKHLLVTTDMLVENDHFRLDWQIPYLIGKKLMECNVSDIVAMGGSPKYAFVSASIKRDTTVEFMDELYKGIHDSAKKHGVLVLGGDTTHGTEYVFNICLIGEIEKDLLRLRSTAKAGDLICITGTLGKSSAGLELLSLGKKGYVQGYLNPQSRTVKEGKSIARFSTAMIDVSDGLASEVRHICEESKVGAEVYYEKIPLSKETKEAAALVGKDPYDYALSGGEDFEICFTIPEKNIPKLKKVFSDFTVVGKIVKKSEGITLIRNKEKTKLGDGYNHFR